MLTNFYNKYDNIVTVFCKTLHNGMKFEMYLKRILYTNNKILKIKTSLQEIVKKKRIKLHNHVA